MKNPLRTLCLLLAGTLPFALLAQATPSKALSGQPAAPASAAASSTTAAPIAAPTAAAPAAVTPPEPREPAAAPAQLPTTPAPPAGDAAPASAPLALPTAPDKPTAPASAASAPAVSSPAEASPAPVAAPAAADTTALVEPTPDRGDLWQRIRNGFSIPDLQGDRVRNHERYYASKPEYVQRMTARGSRYLFHIVEEIEKRGMPMELALLPFAESAFNPQALSSAKASGMWQFMPATGKDFDLRQNLFRDDRRDVLASTRAALDYLQRLHKMMGDWHLALAAYNWGQGNVLRAMSSNRSQGKGTGFEHLSMPEETKNYVPKLQAIKNFVRAPQALGLELPPLENHPYFRTVNIDRDIDVARAAELAGLSIEEFQALNPQMNKPVMLAAATPQVLLPYSNAERFERALQKSRAALASWTAWVAPRTLKPAEAAHYVGMSEAELRQVNRIPERMLVKAGSTLLVPRDTHVHKDVTPHVADNATMMLTPEARPMRRVAFKAGRKGETVASVARKYGLSPAAVAGWNKVPVGGQFKAGQAVVVMLPDVPGRGGRTERTAEARKAPVRAAVAPAARATRKVAAAPAKLAKAQPAARNKKPATVTAQRDTTAKPRVRNGNGSTSKGPRA